jgi:hypothetical protein
MYGDTGVVRALARQLRERADEIGREADDLAGRAERVGWSGLAAEAMRHLVRDHAAGLRACACAHEDAAEALERHAREVDRVKELIAAVEHRVAHVLASVAGGLAGFVSDVLPDSLEHWAAQFDPPPHGSVEWLDVRLPRWA